MALMRSVAVFGEERYLARRLGQQSVGIGAAEAERIDSRHAQRRRRVRPRLQLIHHAQAKCLQVDLWILRLEVQARRNGPMMQRQRGLYNAGNPRTSFQMSN